MADAVDRSSGSLSQSEPSTPNPARVANQNAELQHLAKDMFDKVTVYLQGNLEGTVDEYKLLENMNKMTAQRYSDMKEVTSNVAERLQLLNEKCLNLRPYLDQIDEIDKSSARLEEAAYALDNYVKSLEAKFKQLEKRGASS